MLSSNVQPKCVYPARSFDNSFIYNTFFWIPVNPEVENDPKDSDSSCEDEESLSDSEEYLQDGECELCERYIKLTRHHLIPRHIILFKF